MPTFLTRFFSDLPLLILSLPVILFALSFHEAAHGFVALKLGDPTARNLGRLTLNPAKHLDPIGLICMILFHFGWAKPVPINTRYFKNPRRDMALSGLAGPVSNVLLAVLNALVLRLFLIFVLNRMTPDIYSFVLGNRTVSVGFSVAAILATMLYLGVIINLSYALFNLIPLPPLDGSRIFYVFLPTKWYFAVMKYERYIAIAMLIALWTGLITLPLSAAVDGISNGLWAIFGMKPGTDPSIALNVLLSYVSSLL